MKDREVTDKYVEISYLIHYVTQFRTECARGSRRCWLSELPQVLEQTPGMMVVSIRTI